MKTYWSIIFVVALLATVPFVTTSNVLLNFLVATLLIALVGQGWNLLGGYGGQYSFGQAAFFGTAAYATAVLQMQYGINAWLGLFAGMFAGALVGAVIGTLTQDNVGDGDAELGLQQRAGLVERRGEHRAGGVQGPAHASPLGTLPSEDPAHPDTAAGGASDRTGRGITGGQAGQPGGEVAGAGAGDRNGSI